MIISEENCKGCSVFEDEPDSIKENMIKNNICSKRSILGCPREK